EQATDAILETVLPEYRSRSDRAGGHYIRVACREQDDASTHLGAAGKSGWQCLCASMCTRYTARRHDTAPGGKHLTSPSARALHGRLELCRRVWMVLLSTAHV